MLNLSAYSGKDKQHSTQIMEMCAAEGLTLRECIQSVNNNLRGPEHYCKECGFPAQALPVNVSKCTQTGNKKDKFVLICNNIDCRHTEYIQ